MIDELLKERKITHGRILDVACGTGVLALELANKGHLVHGIDICPEMIEAAKLKSASNTNVSFEVQDMRRFTVQQKSDLIACTFDSLNYLLDIEDVKAMVNRVARALEENGLFVFDSNTEHLYLNRHKEVRSRQLGDETFVQKLEYETKNKIATTIFEFSDGTIEVHKQRPHSLAELNKILDDANFKAIDTFSGFDGKAYTSESERLICIAKK
jgi:2-polyprenyl-3-methyl-5-hydroxy-6-metoxy-1,4-benzoquinol methylase